MGDFYRPPRSFFTFPGTFNIATKALILHKKACMALKDSSKRKQSLSRNTSSYSNSEISPLQEVLDEFSVTLSETVSIIAVVSSEGSLIQLAHNNIKRSSRLFSLSAGDNWNFLTQNPNWQALSNTHGTFQFEEQNYHWVSIILPAPAKSPFKLYLLTQETIPFSWLNIILQAAEATIKSRIKGVSLQKQMDDTHQFTFAIMNSLKVGVMAVNLKGRILFANDTTCNTLNIRRRELITMPIDQLIPNWEAIYQMVSSGEKFINEEINITTPSSKIKFNVNVSPIQDQEQKQLIGLVISMRELENVYHLVNKYTGMQARFTFEDIIAKSQSMRKLVSYAKTIADSPSTVLIEGESGTGKEVFAQSIHNASRRKDKGFVAINCAAIPENLIESELFGYDDGAFTGARKGGHPGKFELSNGGTLFLDEIGDMKIAMQAKLLRAIQEGAITRIGGNKLIPVDVRIIAATNKDLKTEVDNGNFRLDLYYRLSVIPLKIPELKNRKEDLPSLIRFFLNKKSIKLQKQVPQLRYSTLQQLLDYNWPGNIRELENYIEQLVNFNGNISFEKFQEEEEFNSSSPSPEHEAFTAEHPNTDFALTTIKEMERALIIKAINAHKGNMSQVAQTLGIGRNTLYQKIKRYKIDIPQFPN
ncbi:PAS domain-containing protein [Marinilabiliaceae bacterium JC017]|nr:PAS domain-containing protein [Marinilabiliaceae bacterium JC017]